MSEECYFSTPILDYMKDLNDEVAKNIEEIREELKKEEESARTAASSRILRNGPPKMARELAIDVVIPDKGVIVFYSNKELANALGRFGELDAAAFKDCWVLIVDPRYNFSEIVQYFRDAEVIYGSWV